MKTRSKAPRRAKKPQTLSNNLSTFSYPSRRLRSGSRNNGIEFDDSRLRVKRIRPGYLKGWLSDGFLHETAESSPGTDEIACFRFNFSIRIPGIMMTFEVIVVSANDYLIISRIFFASAGAFAEIASAKAFSA